MDADDLMMYGMMLLGAVSVVTIIFVLLNPYISGEKRAESRLQGVSEGARTVRSGSAGKIEEAANSRKQQVAQTLQDLEDKQKEVKKVTMRQRLQRAGLDIDVRSFWIASAICGLVCCGLALMLAPDATFVIPAAVGFAGAFGLPRYIVGYLTKKRQKKFLNNFAGAIDVIIRGVKTGLPLNECLGIIARETEDPIGGEFRDVVEQQRVGVPLAECFERMMTRMPLPEVRFFSIVIAIQSQAGGNLSEALGNLSQVLRDRVRMQQRIKSLSSEAKASAMVLGSLPFIVMLLVYLTTPDYISTLWTTQTGQFVMLVAAFWMSCGMLMMRKMINFKY
jgi:tight adherence protein B